MKVSTRHNRYIVALALAVGLVIAADGGCKGPTSPPSPAPVTVTPPFVECVPSCEEVECGQENDGCSGNCDPGSGCFVSTGYCVPDAVTKVCPPVPGPVCEPKHHGKDKGDHNEDGHLDNGWLNKGQ